MFLKAINTNTCSQIDPRNLKLMAIPIWITSDNPIWENNRFLEQNDVHSWIQQKTESHTFESIPLRTHLNEIEAAKFANLTIL